MITGTDLRIATLNDARSRRSAEKRAAVEDAVLRLRDSTDPNAPRYRVAGDTLGRLSLRELSP